MKEYEEKFDYDDDAEDEESIPPWVFDSDSEPPEKYSKYINVPENKYLITQVFTEDCAAMEPKEAREKLITIIEKEPKEKRALGSLGGAVKNGFLKYDKKTNLFIKIG